MGLQFLSAATGLAALAALARGLSGRAKVGNFLRDVISGAVFVLLPLALVGGAVLVLGGVPHDLDGAAMARTLEGALQTIARGPVAAFEAIKQLGTNGGGFFGPNSAHPFENPSRLDQYRRDAGHAHPADGLRLDVRTDDRAAAPRRRRLRGHGRALILAIVGLCLILEMKPSPAFRPRGRARQPELGRPGAALRSGAGPLWAALDHLPGNGSVNGMLDSHHPATVLVPLVGMWTNVAFGGVGVGLINMFLYIIVGVFICGMMVGRTPEYMSRKIETPRDEAGPLRAPGPSGPDLGRDGPFAALPRLAGFTLPGAHGFTGILYEFTSASANNGSGFEGLADNTAAWNMASAAVMVLGRYLPIIFPLAIGGRLGRQGADARNRGHASVPIPPLRHDPAGNGPPGRGAALHARGRSRPGDRDSGRTGKMKDR